MALSALAAVIMGGALAWKSNQVAFGEATVGVMDWSLEYQANEDALIGPDGNPPVEVGIGVVHNQGDFNLKYSDGAVVITNVIPDAVNALSCGSGNFVGSVKGIGIAYDDPVPPEGTPGPAFLDHGIQFAAMIAVVGGAPEACMGDTVTYAVQIEVQTSGTTAAAPTTP